MDHAECVRPTDIQPLLSPPAHFVEPDRRERANQREAGGQREQKRQHLVTKRQSRQDETEDGIDGAQKDDVGSIFSQLNETCANNVPKIMHPNLANGWRWSMQVLPRVTSDMADRFQKTGGEPKLLHPPLNGVAYVHETLPNLFFRGGRRSPVAGRPDPALGHGTTTTRHRINLAEPRGFSRCRMLIAGSSGQLLPLGKRRRALGYGCKLPH